MCAKTVQFLGIKRNLSRSKRRLLAVLENPENRDKSAIQICQKAGYKDSTTWHRAIKDEQFVAALEALGVSTQRYRLPTHVKVTPAINIEEELAKDIWDMRRLKHDYPKHMAPADFRVDFTWIANPTLREQVKRYFRSRLPQRGARTFGGVISSLKAVLVHLPAEVHIGTLERKHIEALLPAMGRFTE
jgi:hypothetical protein